MSKDKIISSIVFGCQLLLINPSETLAIEKGSTAANFLRIRAGARAVAMGETAVAMSGDSYSTYWNPGSLCQLQEREIGMMYNSWGEGEGQGFLAYAYPFHKTRKNAFGFLVDYYEFGSGMQATESGNIISYNSSADMAVGLCYSKQISERVSIGLTTKYVHCKLITSEGKGIAFDTGLFWNNALKNLNLGITLQNLGSGIQFTSGNSYPIASDFRIGSFWTSVNKKLSLALDIDKPVEDDPYLCIGSEIYLMKDILSIRCGYNNKIGSVAQGMTFGFGFEIPQRNYMRIDYAFVPYGSDLGDTHRISAIAFDAEKAVKNANMKEELFRLTIEYIKGKGI